jgi:polar amino acid transport system substrate-binding protein
MSIRPLLFAAIVFAIYALALAAGAAHAGARGAPAGAGLGLASPLYITTEAAAPSSMPDSEGRVAGVATDKVRAALERAGLGYTIDLLPWKRAYAAARTRPDTCVYSTTARRNAKPCSNGSARPTARSGC